MKTLFDFSKFWNLLKNLSNSKENTIVWSKPKSNLDPRKPKLSVAIDKNNDLVINGTPQRPTYPWTKSDLEKSFSRIQEKIANSGHGITIDAIFIEPYVAGGLWREGSLTLDHLKNADGRYNGLTFEFELSGQKILLSIQTSTYYEAYEFIVSGHPEGHVRVRDVKDVLSEISGEEVF